MNATTQTEDSHSRFVESRTFAAFLVLSAALCLYMRIRHLSERFKVPHDFFNNSAVFGSAGRYIDVFSFLGFVAVFLVIFISTSDRLEKSLILALLAPTVINPLKMLLPAYAATIWWVELGCILVFFLASLAVFLKLSRSGTVSQVAPDSEQIP
ncbi:MAG: hypothetical protein ABSE27_05895 [Acidobacteriaceae bacterium]|jgi:hypothetical protein